MIRFLKPASSVRRLLSLAVVLLLAGSAWPGSPFVPTAQADAPLGVVGVNGMKGVSFVPSSVAPFGSPQAAESLQKLAGTGANWVAVVAPFHVADRSAFSFFRVGANGRAAPRVQSFSHNFTMRQANSNDRSEMILEAMRSKDSRIDPGGNAQ